MRYILTIFWAFLLSQMLVYVVSSMTGATYNFTAGVIVAAVLSLAVFVLGDAGIPKESN